jgi:hypothetical protein
MPIYFKTLICTEKPIFDINDNLLRPGKYIFEVTDFSEKGGIIKGYVMGFNDNRKIKVEFKYFSVIKLMSKAQSWLLRRTELDTNPNFPNAPSPPPSPNDVNKKAFVEPMNLTLSYFDRCLSKRNKIILDKLEKEECSICLGEENLNKKLKCGHIFHDKCIKEWIEKGSSTCPVCRATIEQDNYLRRCC